jgi:DNA-binding GntR family transcriptional regulator
MESELLCLAMEFADLERHAAANFGAMSVMLERIYGIRIVEIDQSIEAVALDAKTARSLGYEVGAPAFKAVRRYYRRGWSSWQ